MYRRRRRARKTGKMKRKTDPYHGHTISCGKKSNLKEILTSDDVEEFKKYIDEHEAKTVEDVIFTECNRSRCRMNTKECKTITPIAAVSYFWCGEILNYLIEQGEKMKALEYWEIINNMTNKRKNYTTRAVEFIKQHYKETLYSEEEKKKLYEISLRKKCWDMIVLLDETGYITLNVKQLLLNIPYTIYKTSMREKYENNVDEACYVECVAHGSMNKEFIESYNKYHETFANKKYAKKYEKIFESKYDVVNTIKYMVDKGFIITKECLDKACKQINLPLVLYLLELKMEVSEKNIYNIFMLDYEEYRAKKNNRQRRLRYGYNSEWRRNKTAKNKGIRMRNHKNYASDMIKLLKNIEFNAKESDMLIKRALLILLYGRQYDIIREILGGEEGPEIGDYYISRLVNELIKNDDLENLKQLFELKIVEPITISKSSHNYDMALRTKSDKMMNYFADELSMRASLNIVASLNLAKDCINTIQGLKRVGYPIDEAFILQLCDRGTLKGIEYVIETHKIKLKGKMVDRAIANKKYNMANYLIKKGCPITKMRMIDRIVNRMKNKTRTWRYRSRSSAQLCDARMILFIINLGGTGTINAANKLVEMGCFIAAIRLYEKTGIMAKDSGNILNYIITQSRRYRGISASNILKYLNFKKKMGLQLAKYDEVTLNACIRSLLSYSGCDIIKLLKRIVEATKYEFNISHMYMMTELWNDRNILIKVKYLIKNGVDPTKEIFNRICMNGNDALIKYLMEMYGYTLTLKEFHTLLTINYMNRRNIITLIRIFEMTPTPYTVGLMVHKYRGKWDGGSTDVLLEQVKKITQGSKEILMESTNRQLKQKVRNMEVVEYEPREDEKVDYDILHLQELDINDEEW